MERIRGVQERHGTYYARLTIPAELRQALGGKRELRERLGTDRRQAERDCHAVLARFNDHIAQARRSLQPDSRPRVRPLSLDGLARLHFAEELEIDSRDRNQPDGSEDHSAYFRLGQLSALKRVASGRASNDEVSALVGWAIDTYEARGLTRVERNSAAWRDLGRTLAVVQIEVIARQAERDQGNSMGCLRCRS